MSSDKSYAVVLGVFLAGFLTACSGTGGGSPPVITSAIDGKEMVLVPAGEFIMGTDKVDTANTHRKIGTVKPLYADQHPERKIRLPAYYIDRYEVTNREYRQFLEATQFDREPGHWENGVYPEGMANRPVTNIAWDEALAYALWAHKLLPTEEQWEKAARGAKGRLFPWGDELSKTAANVGVEGARESRPVGSYPEDVSPYRVYDMAGNVMEWTLDWYRAYPGNEYNDPRFGAAFKVIRGNGFQKAGHYFLDAYRYAFYRTEAPAEAYFENVGFRTVTPFIEGK